MAKHDGDFGYTNDYRRKDPEKYGWGDCSSTIAQAYRQCAGIEIGERSFNIAADPDAYTVASATSWRDLPLSDMKPADIICMGWHSGAFAGRISHVELYAGPGLTWGHGGPGRGPRLHRLSDSRLTGSANIIMVRRFIEDDDNTSKGDDLTPDEHNMLSWLYENIKVPGEGFGYPQATQNALGDLTQAVQGLQSAVDGVNALVAKVNDLLTVPGWGFGYPAASHNALEEVVTKLNDVLMEVKKKNG
jgi:hypothetical protein